MGTRFAHFASCVKFSTMKLRHLVWAFCFCALYGRSGAAEWDVRRFEGREYVTLENIAAFYDLMRKVINDPSVVIEPVTRNQRPAAPPSRIDSEAFHSLEGAYRAIYGVVTLPIMSTGATDMAFLRAKGVQCYGIGAMVDEEDAAKGFGAHSDQERILEESVYKHVAFFWEAVTKIAGRM